MLFTLQLPYFFLLLILYLLHALVEDVGGLFGGQFGLGVYLLGLFELDLKICFEFSDLIFFVLFELLHILFVDHFDLNKFLLELEILLNFEIDLLLITALYALRLLQVIFVQILYRYTGLRF